MESKYKTNDFSTLNQKFNSGEVKPFTFKKITRQMLKNVLKEISKRTYKDDINYYVANSQINDELYTWDVVLNNKN